MKGHGCDSEKPKTLLIGRPFFTKDRPHGTITVSSTFVGKNGNKKPGGAGLHNGMNLSFPQAWSNAILRDPFCKGDLHHERDQDIGH